MLFYKMLTQREDVLKVFQEYSANGQTLSPAELEDFLREEQFEGADVQQHAKQLIERYEPSDTGTPVTLENELWTASWIMSFCPSVLPAKLLNAMTFDGFLMYLGSTEGCIFNPGRRGIFQDLSQPLCHYFIASSHNTYLMEDQLRGHSSVEGYIR